MAWWHHKWSAFWRKHFLCYWPFVRGIHRSLVDTPHKGQWHRALMFSLICAWTNGWANNRDTIMLIIKKKWVTEFRSPIYRNNSLRPTDASVNLHWLRQWLVAWPAPSHYLNQRWNIVNWTLRNKLQWNLNRNLYIFIQENTFENVWKWRPFYLGLNELIM